MHKAHVISGADKGEDGGACSSPVSECFPFILSHLIFLLNPSNIDHEGAKEMATGFFFPGVAFIVPVFSVSGDAATRPHYTSVLSH